MNVKITKAGGRLLLESPYHPGFPKAANKLGGRWKGTSKTWTFDGRDEERVRELVRKYYGTTGDDGVERVTVRIELDSGPSRGADMWINGYRIARAFDRDGGAKLGDGVIVTSGGFTSGGSRKNFDVRVREGTVVELRDVPKPLAVEIVEDRVDLEGADKAELVAGDPAVPDVEVLKAERERLVDRVIELDGQIAELEGRAGEKLPDPVEPDELEAEARELAEAIESGEVKVPGDPTPPPAPKPEPPKPARKPGDPMTAAEFFGR
jgi:hypothetical protein